ncbi:prolipoprotein diacylglyceryl transferase [Bdellovibrio sp. 22V]|uniref:prolipoprotein diacylglyceryl transferase n=1 Tax=Bdellovibrio bacteriovorus TaxID=959 RepID=UPI002542C00E|nr:prolipoprotein diacylglyceryl transferase [Bdellovibrio sp. 22V]WII73946.1 prolipoprotein diacylglyceryl transferase [Bdellovibrio sp. 22V]
MSLTVCICLIWITRRAVSHRLSRKRALDVSLIIMVSGFIGGRLFHVLYENFDYYRQSPVRVLHVWNGGFVFYGGALLAGLLSILFLAYKNKNDYEKYLDLFAPVLSFAYAAGRSACFLAGCCYGKFCDLPWAVEGRHPTQAYAVLWELGVIFVLIGCEKVPREFRKPEALRNPGSIFYLWMILHGLGRFFMELQRDDFRGPSLGLSISSWISLMVVSLGLFLLFRKPTNRSSASAP